MITLKDILVLLLKQTLTSITLLILVSWFKFVLMIFSGCCFNERFDVLEVFIECWLFLFLCFDLLSFFVYVDTIWQSKSKVMLIGFFIFTKISLYPWFFMMKESLLQVLIPTVGITNIWGLSWRKGYGITTLILVEKYGGGSYISSLTKLQSP